MRKSVFRATAAAVASAALVATAACSSGDGTDGMPDQLVWSTYGTGTSTYADLAAVADAVTTNEDIPVRIVTSDTAVGRLAPVQQGQAHFARTGDEYIFSFEGDYDFATEEWGPQETRVVWAPTAPHGLMVRDSSDIQTFEDLRGSNFPRITANPSVNNKLEAFLAYGGLTWDDVNVVQVSYSDQPDALNTGQLDVLFQQVYGSSLYELESAFDVRWLDMDDESPEKVQAVQDIAPSVDIGEFSGAPGQDEGESANGMMYSVPVVAFADADEEMVYETVRAIADNFDDYADATATTPDWAPDEVLLEPRQVPFHDGLIRYLEEEDLWTEEAQRLNDELIERGETLIEGWEEVVAENDEDDLAEAWSEWKADVPRPELIDAESTDATDDDE